MPADEWELVDDDGFIYYKRRKKPVAAPPTVVLPLAITRPVLPVQCQVRVLSDEAELCAGEAAARRKKMAMLLAQKKMYSDEIGEWETELRKQEEAFACVPVPEFRTELEQASLHSSDDSTLKHHNQKLLLQVEAYEKFIGQLKTLLDQGERTCQQLEMAIEVDRVGLEQDLLMDANKLTPRTIVDSLQEQAPCR